MTVSASATAYVARRGTRSSGRRQQRAHLGLVVEGPHDVAEDVGQAVDLVGDQAGGAGGHVEEPVGQEAVAAHVVVVVVEDDAGGAVQRAEVLVGDDLGGDQGRGEEPFPVGPVYLDLGADGERGPHGAAVDVAGVAHEQHRRAGVGLGPRGVEHARVGALQQRRHGDTRRGRGPGRPRRAGGVHAVEAGHLLAGHQVGMADHPLQVDPPGRRRDPVEPAQHEHDVVEVAGTPVALVAGVDRDPLAEPFEGVGHGPREVRVAPALPAATRRRRDVEGPAQRRHPLAYDGPHGPHDRARGQGGDVERIVVGARRYGAVLPPAADDLEPGAGPRLRGPAAATPASAPAGRGRRRRRCRGGAAARP